MTLTGMRRALLAMAGLVGATLMGVNLILEGSVPETIWFSMWMSIFLFVLLSEIVSRVEIRISALEAELKQLGRQK